MVLTDATPAEVLQWFHEEDLKHDILCIFLAPSQRDQKQVAEFVADLCELDVSMGDRVAFLLFYPGANKPLALPKKRRGTPIFPGEVLLRRRIRRAPVAIADIYLQLDASARKYLSEEIASIVSKQMAVFTFELAKLLEVPRDAIPAMCILVKGNDDATVLPLGDAWKPDVVMKWLRQLAKIAERDDVRSYPRSVYEPMLEEIRQLTKGLKDVDDAISARLQKLEDGFQKFYRAFSGTEEDQQRMANYLQRQNFSSSSLNSLIVTLSFGKSAGVEKDGQFRRIKRLIAEIETYQTRAEKQFDRVKPPETVATLADQQRQSRPEMLRQVKELGLSEAFNVQVQKVSELATSVRKVEITASRWGSFGKKLLAGALWLRHVAGLP